MTLSVPYSFVPGTKAKASEVNANFNAVLEQLDETNGLKLNKDLSNLTSTGLDFIKNSVSGKNIGEIVYSSIPLTDSGLHLLDGSLLRGNGIYADFVEYMSGLYSDLNYQSLFISEANWQTSITNYGVCGKFVYDEDNDTLRLPKITGIIEGTTDINALGTLVEAGLPNITGGFGSNYFGSFYGACTYTGRTVGNSSGDNIEQGQGTFDASLSSSIYGNSTTVQPQTVKVFVYIVVATSIKTEAQIDIDNINTELNAKANKDLSNCTKPYITETYENGQSGYNLYSNGFCEQWGVITTQTTGAQVITLMKSYKDTSYHVVACSITNSLYASVSIYSSSSIQLETRGFDYSAQPCNGFWVTKGYIS